MKLKNLFIFLVACVPLLSCQSDPYKWSDAKVEKWLQQSKFSEFSYKISPEVNKRELIRQYKLNQADWDATIDLLKQPGLPNLPLGSHNVLTDHGAYYNVQEAETRLQNKYEAHRKAIDVQVVTSGQERIDIATLDQKGEQLAEYDETKDYELFHAVGDVRSTVICPGQYVILFPGDAHQPLMAVDGKVEKIKKVVVKVPYVK